MNQGDGIFPMMSGVTNMDNTTSVDNLKDILDALSFQTDYKESFQPKYVYGILRREWYTRRQWFLIKKGYFHRRGCGPLWEILPNGKLKFVGNQELM